MTQRAAVHGGIIIDLGPHIVGREAFDGLADPRDPALVAYPDDMLADVPDEARLGWTWDGKAAAEPVPVMPAGVRVAYGDDLIRALADDQVAALSSGKLRDQRLLGAQRKAFPEDNPKIARLAAAMKTTPIAWFDAALGGDA